MMQPTMKLRYVKREVPAWNGMIGGPPCSKVIEVLQQWWEENSLFNTITHLYDEVIPAPKGEWRDIPIEEQS